MNKNQKSRRSRGFAWMCKSGLLLGAAALLTTSCATDGYDDDERFDNGVSGQALTSPSADDITITPSADGKTQTITWPVVMGAGGYKVRLVDESNPQEPVINDSIVDGCSVTGKREEDVNYKLTIQAMGNANKGNSEAPTATEKLFSTFTPTFKTIPNGSNLNEWFAANPVPADSIGVNLNYDFEAGGVYSLSEVLDFNANAVTLRSTSKSNHATIKYTGSATITFAAAFNVKYLDFDCTEQELPADNYGLFAFSKNATSATGVEIDAVKYKWDSPLIVNPVTFVSSNFKNVRGYFFWDNQQKVCAMTMLVDNCVVQLAPQKALAGGVFWTNKAGHVNDLYVTNSTFYELPDNEGDYKYFYQAGMVRGEDIYADKSIATNSVNYQNSTFYHVTWNGGQWGNYNGMAGRAYSHWVMTDCIFVDCSPSGVPRRFLHGKQNQTYVTFANNTYMKADGTFQDIKDDGSHEYDQSGTTIEADPQFANPAAGDFTIGGPTQIARKTGDPRWIP